MWGMVVWPQGGMWKLLSVPLWSALENARRVDEYRIWDIIYFFGGIPETFAVLVCGAFWLTKYTDCISAEE